MNTSRFWQLDTNGFLKNDAAHSKISQEFKEVIEAFKQTCLKHLLPALHSCYLTGSISRGTATPKVSDLDGFAVLKKDAITDLSWKDQAKHSLLKSYPIVSDIQLEVWKWTDLFGVPKKHLSEFQVILKLNSLCLWGEDLSQNLPPIRPDRALAYTEIVSIKPDIEEALQGITRQPQETEFWCKKIMKNLIRAAFYLVITQEKAFTRDLPLCMDTFLKYYPELEEIRTCAKHLKQPLLNPHELKKFLRGKFVSQLVTETSHWLEAYHVSIE